MYQALYRSFRPETFDGILGQEHIVKILKNQIDTHTTSHAYLFCGTRGTGKTSTARILAKAVNCLAPEGGRPCGTCEHCVSIKNGTFMDVVEIDAASNNGVENIRELRESVKYPPVSGRCKVYIIDEVHMLSSGAFNALLKTLEEPPAQVMFILATTEVHKLPATILSRCLRLDFKRVPERQLKEGMRRICQEIGVAVEESALGLLCANADGSVRDGLSLLDQCISGGGTAVSRQEVLEILGACGEEALLELTDYAVEGQIAEALLFIHRLLSDGKDVRQLLRDWIEHFRSLLMIKYIEHPEEVLNMSAENVQRLRGQSQRLPLSLINSSILELSQTLSDAKWSAQPRVLLELSAIHIGSGAGGKDAPVPPNRLNAVGSEAASSGIAAAASRKDASGAAANKSAAAAGRCDTAPLPPAAADSKQGEELPPWELSAAENTAVEAAENARLTASTAAKVPVGDKMPEKEAVQPSARVQADEAERIAAEGSATWEALESEAVQAELPDGEQPRPKPAEQPQGMDLDALWNSMFEDARASRGSFQLLHMGSVLRGVTASEFFVEANNDVMKGLLKSNETVLEQLMEERIGRKLRMVLDDGVQQERAQENCGQKAQQLAQAMEQRLGISIEVK